MWHFYAALAEHQAAAFAWGTYDCATLWAAAASAITGRHPFAGLPGWWSARSAQRVLIVSGHCSVEDFVAARFPEVAIADVRPGDLVFAHAVAPMASPAVVVTVEALTRSADSLVMLPLTQQRRAFAVG